MRRSKRPDRVPPEMWERLSWPGKQRLIRKYQIIDKQDRTEPRGVRGGGEHRKYTCPVCAKEVAFLDRHLGKMHPGESSTK